MLKMQRQELSEYEKNPAMSKESILQTHKAFKGSCVCTPG